MALQVGELFATLKIEDRGAQQQLNNLGSSFGGLKAIAFGAFAGIGAAAVSAIGEAVAAMGEAIQTGIEYNAMLEQSQIAWTTLTHSQKQATNVMSQLQILAKQTPFEYEGLDKAAKMLRMAGFEGKQLIPTLTTVGDAVSAVGGGQEELQGVAMALFQMGAKGKVSAEEMNQLAERGIPSWKLLANSMGLSVAQVMKLSQNGKLMASDALPKIIQGMNKAFGGSMAKQAGTFNGQMANLQDTFKQTAAHLSKPLFNAIKEQLPSVIRLIQGLPARLNAMKAGFQSFASSAGNAFAPIVEFIRPALEAVWQFIQSIWNQIVAFWNQNGQMIIQATQNVWNVIKAVITVAMAIITPIIQVAWQVILFFIQSVWNNITGVIQGALSIIMGVIQVFAGLLTGNWSAMWNGIQSIVLGAVQLIWNLIQLIFVARVLGAFRALWTGGVGLVTSMWTGLRSLFSGGITGVTNLVKTGWNLILRLVQTVSNGIKNVITLNWNAIRAAVMSAMNTIRSLISGAWSAIRSAVSNAMSAVGSAIRNGWSRAVSFIRGINLYSIGRNIIQGLVNGIGSMMSTVMDKAASIASAVKNKISSALSIHSPSRVTFELGQYVGQGLALGMEKSLRSVSRAAGKMAMQATPRVSPIAASHATNQTQHFTVNNYGSNALSEKAFSNQLRRWNYLNG